MSNKKYPQTTIEDSVIDAAIEKHGKSNVKVLSIPKNEEETELVDVLAIVPTRQIVGEFEKYADRQPNKAKEILVKSCILTEKDLILADDGMFNGAVNGLAELIPLRKATVKNL